MDGMFGDDGGPAVREIAVEDLPFVRTRADLDDGLRDVWPSDGRAGSDLEDPCEAHCDAELTEAIHDAACTVRALVTQPQEFGGLLRFRRVVPERQHVHRRPVDLSGELRSGDDLKSPFLAREDRTGHPVGRVVIGEREAREPSVHSQFDQSLRRVMTVGAHAVGVQVETRSRTVER
jgi:hypothetical protein